MDEKLLSCNDTVYASNVSKPQSCKSSTVGIDYDANVTTIVEFPVPNVYMNFLNMTGQIYWSVMQSTSLVYVEITSLSCIIDPFADMFRYPD